MINKTIILNEFNIDITNDILDNDYLIYLFSALREFIADNECDAEVIDYYFNKFINDNLNEQQTTQIKQFYNMK